MPLPMSLTEEQLDKCRDRNCHSLRLRQQAPNYISQRATCSLVVIPGFDSAPSKSVGSNLSIRICKDRSANRLRLPALLPLTVRGLHNVRGHSQPGRGQLQLLEGGASFQAFRCSSRFCGCRGSCVSIQAQPRRPLPCIASPRLST